MLSYLYAKVHRGMRGKAILNSSIHPTANVNAGCNILDSTMDIIAMVAII